MRVSFGTRELEQLPVLLGRAEDLIGTHFKISRFAPERYPFEIATLERLDPREIVPHAFAQVSRYAVPNRTQPGRGLLRPLYRICLQDHNLLRAVQRDDLSTEALILYVLTHELCHIVRFCDYRQLFEADPDRRFREEARVHCITHEILSPLKDAGIQRVLELYDGHEYAA
jgi:hypothetical protein